LRIGSAGVYEIGAAGVPALGFEPGGGADVIGGAGSGGRIGFTISVGIASRLAV